MTGVEWIILFMIACHHLVIWWLRKQVLHLRATHCPACRQAELRRFNP